MEAPADAASVRSPGRTILKESRAPSPAKPPLMIFGRTSRDNTAGAPPGARQCTIIAAQSNRPTIPSEDRHDQQADPTDQGHRETGDIPRLPSQGRYAELPPPGRPRPPRNPAAAPRRQQHNHRPERDSRQADPKPAGRATAYPACWWPSAWTGRLQ